jgi:hypothetical protein
MPAAAAAFKARKVPSRAGMMRSSSCLGNSDGKGDATWCTYVQPCTASAQPSSESRDATAKERRGRSLDAAPPFVRVLRTLASRERLRIVVRTVYPADSRARITYDPMKPEPPVTRTVVEEGVDIVEIDLEERVWKNDLVRQQLRKVESIYIE